MSDLNTRIPTGSRWILTTASAILEARGRSRHGALQRPDAGLSPGARQEGPVRARLYGPPMSADCRIG